MSKETTTEGFVGMIFGREYRTRAFIAGYTLTDWREIFFRGRTRSLAACVAGATRDTRRADSLGLVPLMAGSLLNAWIEM